MSKWLVVYVGQKVPEIVRYVQLRLSFICACSFGKVSLTNWVLQAREEGGSTFL